MQNKKVAILFIILCAVQLSVPASIIIQREIVLEKGERFLFRTRPVDPYDAFRGRYVALRFKQNFCPYNGNRQLRRNQTVYVTVEEGSDGFAKFAELSMAEPDRNNFIEMKVNYIKNNKAYLRITFDRYYMEEKAAPLAERAYQQRSGNKNTYAAVKIKSGIAVLEDLFIDDTPIEEYIKR